MIDLDIEYARLILPSLDLGEERAGRFNFRCPYCGDSQKDKNKKRAWFYPRDEKLLFHCFNCGKSTSFSYFIKDSTNPKSSPFFAQKYYLEKFGKKPVAKPQLPNIKPKTYDNIFSDFVSVRDSKIATDYLMERGFDPRHKAFDDLLFTDNFNQFYNKYTGKNLMIRKEPRIVFPLINKSGKAFGAQGRSISGKIRYMTAVSDSSYLATYGMHKASTEAPMWLCEGGFDALHLDNGIAALNANLSSRAEHLNLDKSETILLFDNEPGNKEVCLFMKSAIEKGWSLAFWKQKPLIVGKDVNEAVLRKFDISDLFKIDKGLSARLTFSKWRGNLS